MLAAHEILPLFDTGELRTTIIHRRLRSFTTSLVGAQQQVTFDYWMKMTTAHLARNAVMVESVHHSTLYISRVDIRYCFGMPL